MKKAIIKFNNGNGAILCPKCRAILKTFADLTSEEIDFYKKHKYLKAPECNKCKIK